MGKEFGLDRAIPTIKNRAPWSIKGDFYPTKPTVRPPFLQEHLLDFRIIQDYSPKSSKTKLTKIFGI